MTDKTAELDGFADVPLAERRRPEKYGMPIEYADRIVERHFGVLGEEQAIHAAQMAHNIRVGPALADALARNAKG